MDHRTRVALVHSIIIWNHKERTTGLWALAVLKFHLRRDSRLPSTFTPLKPPSPKERSNVSWEDLIISWSVRPSHCTLPWYISTIGWVIRKSFKQCSCPCIYWCTGGRVQTYRLNQNVVSLLLTLGGSCRLLVSQAVDIVEMYKENWNPCVQNQRLGMKCLVV